MAEDNKTLGACRTYICARGVPCAVAHFQHLPEHDLIMEETVIAVVDDDLACLKAIGRLLGSNGYRVQMFESAENFLTFAATSEARCLVVDVQLNDISGIEMVRHLVATGFRVPVIFVTGASDATFEAQARSLGCAGYLHKPFAANDMLAIVTKALRLNRNKC